MSAPEVDLAEIRRECMDGIGRGDLHVVDRLLVRLRSVGGDGRTPSVEVLLLIATLLAGRFTLAGAERDLREALGVLRRAGDLGASGPADPHHGEWALASAMTYISAYHVSQNAEVLDRAIGLLRPVEPRTPAVLHLLATALFLRGTAAGVTSADQLGEQIGLLRECLAVVPPGSPQRPSLASMLGFSLVSLSEVTGDPAAAAEARELLARVLATIPAGHPERAQLVPAYARCLITTEDPGDVELAIRELSAAERHPDVLQVLAEALLVRSARTGSRADADRAAALAEQAAAATRGVARLGALAAGGQAYLRRFLTDGDRIDLDRSLAMFAELRASPTALEIGVAAAYAQALRQRGDRADLDAAVELLAGVQNEEQPRIILAMILSVRATQHSGDLGDVRRALTLLDGTRPGPAIATVHATATGAAYLAAYQIAGDPADLDHAVRALRRDDPAEAARRDVAERLLLLGTTLTASARYLGGAGIHEAITVLRQAESMVDDRATQAAALRYQLGNALATAGFRDAGRLDEAVGLLRAVLRGPDPLLVTRAQAIGRLGSALTLRFHAYGRPEDLTEGIVNLRQSLAQMTVEGIGRWITQMELAMALSARFEQYGDAADIETAAGLMRTVTAKAGLTRSYGSILLEITRRTRLRRPGGEDGLDEGIGLLRDILDAIPPTHIEYAVAAANLAAALVLRFHRDGRGEDLDRAIAIGRTLAGDDEPDPRFAANLSAHLKSRYDLHGHLPDLDDAIEASRTAVERASGQTVRAGLLSRLGRLLMARGDLDEAITVGRRAAAMDGPDLGHFERGRLRADLAGTLVVAFEHTGQRVHLEEAIDRIREAIEVSSADDLYRSSFLATLGQALERRWRTFHDDADLRAAVTALRDALAKEEPASPDHAQLLAVLAGVLLTDGLHRDDPSTVAVARDHGREAAHHPAVATESRIEGAATWGNAARWLDDLPEVQAAFTYAVGLLAPLAWRGISRVSQETALSHWSGAGPQASAAALANQDPGSAVELLERGRGVLWTGLLDTRSSLDDLTDRAPDLAAELVRVRRGLDG
ncbi:hypothetical protein Aca07nite_00770 [Actinoplanes capillaceus]|uniref:Tetratricopeptide repeat-containing protein n=1 Tax=Actinoplanes campanulatus TaxID=113559 RepID=A0ABQ3W740_9ACTN|nr:hypothetical protein [Actinoplanes capillaceus]GID42802.1 hypothetical protein Aca07nite_00770 [Actinoplanes capillaceus]